MTTVNSLYMIKKLT